MSVSDLLNAAKFGLVGRISQLLEQGVAVDGLGYAGNTALTEASRRGHVTAVQQLRYWGADANIANEAGCTALMYACSRGHVSVAELLLRSGASYNLKNNQGETALSMMADRTKQAQLQAVINSLVVSPATFSVIPEPPPPASTLKATTTAVMDSGEPLRMQLARVTNERDSLLRQLTTTTALMADLRKDKDTQTAQLRERTQEGDRLFAKAGQEKTGRTNEMKDRAQIWADRMQLVELTAELVQRTRERDALIAERDQLLLLATSDHQVPLPMPAETGGITSPSAADGCPFMRYQPHCFVPGVVPAGSGLSPGLYDVSNTSLLFLYLRQLCDTGGSWMMGGQQRLPVVDFQLARVQAVVPEAFLLNGFTSAQGRINALLRSRARFNHDNNSNSHSQDEFTVTQQNVLNVLREMFHEKAPDNGNNSKRTVNTVYCYHGHRREHLESICSNGMVAVGGMDAGYFGAGCYTTLNMEYAVRYAHGDFDTETRRAAPPEGLYPIIMFAAAVGKVYPVTREVDYDDGETRSKFFGRPLKRGFDAHVACVNQAAAYQAVSREQCEYVELVIDQQAQLLPLAVLWFQKI